jgi:glycosyltransferase involved in cell wall biosynthesis
MIDQNSDWVILYENLPYNEYVKVVSKCKYGIHCKQEPFGISIAEMVKANAVPFVKDKGGQVEIVGKENQDLLFQNPDRAVEKIVNILSNSERLNQVRTALQERQTLFSSDRFTRDIRSVVGNFLEAKKRMP